MNSTGSRVLVALAVALAGLSGAAAQAPVDPRDPALPAGERLEALIERVRYEHRRIETLEAEFLQRKASQLLVEPVESRGTFAFAAPDRVRWEYRTPDPISLLIAGDVMTTWYRDLNRAEKVEVGGRSEKVLQYLGAGSSLETLVRYFDARLAMPKDPEAPLRIELTPRYERLAKRLSEMTLWLAAGSYLPVGLRYVEADGDVTEYRFSNLRLNRPLDDDRFRLLLPADVDLLVIDDERHAALR